MLKLFFGVLLGYLLFTNPQARQVTADLLRAGGDAFAPSDDCKTLREHFTDLIGGTDEVPADCSVLLLSTRYGSTEVCNPVAYQFGNYRNYQTQHGRTSAYRTAETKARQTGNVYRIVAGDGNLIDLFYP